MSTKIFIFSLLFIGGLFAAVNGDAGNDENNQNKTTKSNIVQRANNRVPMRIPMPIMRMMKNLINETWKNIKMYARPIIRGFKSVVIDFIGYLASSDDTRVSRVKRSIAEFKDEPKERKASSGGVSYILSSAFMLPFKVAYGSVKFIPIKSVYGTVTNVFKPVGRVITTPAFRAVGNATSTVANYASAQAWIFTKDSVFPKLDNFITTLDNSKAVPDGVMKYLKDLQTLYRFMKALHFV